MADKQPTCDVCGKPATNSAVDEMVAPHFASGMQIRQPVGGARYGCDEHPAKSYEHKFSGWSQLVR